MTNLLQDLVTIYDKHFRMHIQIDNIKESFLEFLKALETFGFANIDITNNDKITLDYYDYLSSKPKNLQICEIIMRLYLIHVGQSDNIFSEIQTSDVKYNSFTLKDMQPTRFDFNLISNFALVKTVFFSEMHDFFFIEKVQGKLKESNFFFEMQIIEINSLYYGLYNKAKNLPINNLKIEIQEIEKAEIKKENISECDLCKADFKGAIYQKSQSCDHRLCRNCLDLNNYIEKVEKCEFFDCPILLCEEKIDAKHLRDFIQKNLQKDQVVVEGNIEGKNEEKIKTMPKIITIKKEDIPENEIKKWQEKKKIK